MAAGPLETSTTWHLVIGPTGAGKSTLSRQLVAQHAAIPFAIDEWMSNLFWPDLLEKSDYSWALARVHRCEEQIAAVARPLAAQGISSVLDLGFTQREQRLAWIARAHAAGVAVQLHVLDVDVTTRWHRVVERNKGVSDTFAFAVTREMFDLMESLWEPVDLTEHEACTKA